MTIIKKNDYRKNYKIKNFINQKMDELLQIRKRSRIFWVILSSLVGLINLANLGVSIYLFFSLVNSYSTDVNATSFWGSAGPTIFIASATILLFPLTLVATIYQSIMRADVYREAIEKMQFLAIAYKVKSEPFDQDDRNILYKKEVQKIVDGILNKKGRKILLKSALSKTLGISNVK